MGTRPRERAGEVTAGGGGRRSKAPRVAANAAPTRRASGSPRPARRAAKPIATAQRSRDAVSWRYRVLEQVVSSAAVAVAALAVLTLALEADPTVFIATLTATALVAALVMLGLERARRRAPGRARHLLNAAVVLATVNMVGGFVVTDRMLQMFTSRKSPKEGTDA